MTFTPSRALAAQVRIVGYAGDFYGNTHGRQRARQFRVRSGDLQFIYDWEASRWLSAPIGAQLGKVTKIAGPAVRFAVNPQYNLIKDDGLEQWKVLFTFTLLAPSK